MHYMNIAKHRCMNYLSMKENWNQLNCLIIPFDAFQFGPPFNFNFINLVDMFGMNSNLPNYYYYLEILGFF